MTPAKPVAERLAGPHSPTCDVFIARHKPICDCPRRERVAAIEAAIRGAEELARADERRLPHCSIEGEDWYQDALAEARRQGRESMREEAADRLREREPYLYAWQSAIDAILALPLEGPGEEGR